MRWQRWTSVALLYTVVIAFTTFMLYLNLLFGVKYSPEQTAGWIKSSLLSFIVDAVLQQPSMIVVRTLLPKKLLVLLGIVLGGLFFGYQLFWADVIAPATGLPEDLFENVPSF